MEKARELKRVHGFKLNQKVLHDGYECWIKSFPSRRNAAVKYASEHPKWATATVLVPVKELVRIS